VNTYIDSLAYLKRFIRIPFKLAEDGITRIEMVPSYTAVREALANLLMHRDYFERGFAAVRVFPGKITFRNPGPSLLSMEEILSALKRPPQSHNRPCVSPCGMGRACGKWHAQDQGAVA
jgi:predicted HTH transcriptional regulator